MKCGGAGTDSPATAPPLWVSGAPRSPGLGWVPVSFMWRRARQQSVCKSAVFTRVFVDEKSVTESAAPPGGEEGPQDSGFLRLEVVRPADLEFELDGTCELTEGDPVWPWACSLVSLFQPSFPKVS